MKGSEIKKIQKRVTKFYEQAKQRNPEGMKYNDPILQGALVMALSEKDYLAADFLIRNGANAGEALKSVASKGVAGVVSELLPHVRNVEDIKQALASAQQNKHTRVVKVIEDVRDCWDPEADLAFGYLADFDTFGMLSKSGHKRYCEYGNSSAGSDQVSRPPHPLAQNSSSAGGGAAATTAKIKPKGNSQQLSCGAL